MDTSIELPITVAEHLTHGHMQQSRLGLQQPSGSTAVRKRAPPKSAPKRAGPIWATVQVLSEHATSPQLECVNCGAKFCGGASRVRDYITGVETPRAARRPEYGLRLIGPVVTPL